MIQVVRRFQAAPWPTSLKVVSLLGTIGLGVASYVAYRAVPTALGFTHNFGLGVAVIPVLVLLSSLYDDYYAFEESKFRLIGRRTRRVFRIGDRVAIRVALADVEKNLLHFALLRDDRAPRRGGKR